MDRTMSLFAGIGLGAGLMYFLDPQTGRRRRALLRDQLVSATSRLDDCLGATWSDVRQRMQGLAAEASALFTREPPDDRVMAERVRSKIGRYLSHPGSVEVAARDGRVTLSGPVLAREVDWLLDAVSSVPGVTGVDNRLEMHARAGDVSGLQGGGRRPGERLNLAEANWAPATRLLAGAAGGALLTYGFTQRFPISCVLGTVGLGLLARAATNTEMTRLLGLGGGRRAVDVQKTFTIAGPVERVFPVFARYGAFPSFMAHLREVRDLGGGRSHWVAEGPAGAPVSWDARVTVFEPNRLLAWRSEPGSVIANSGIIRFEPTPQGDTRVDIRFSYNPPGGVLGHLAARLFGADAKSAMDEDLVRLKSLLEEGTTSAPEKGETARQEITQGMARPAL
jgi:uncharacterized membrane protein